MRVPGILFRLSILVYTFGSETFIDRAVLPRPFPCLQNWWGPLHTGAWGVPLASPDGYGKLHISHCEANRS